MSNPNIVYLANDSPRPSTSTTTAKQTGTITSNILTNQVLTFSSEIQLTPPGVSPAYSSEQGNVIPGYQNNLSGINPPLPSNTGYYDLAPNVDVLPLDYASNYLAGGYCDYGCSNVWGFTPNEVVSVQPSTPQIKEMAHNPCSAPDNPSHSSTVFLDTSKTSKQYNQEVDKFLNKIKIYEGEPYKTKVKKKVDCDCTKYKKNKTSVKHVPMKKTKPTKDRQKVSSVKSKVLSQNRINIEKIKKKIDLIENEIQRRKTELSVKEQQIQNEINIIQNKQPMIKGNSTNELFTSSDNERDILVDQAFETEPSTNEFKKKRQIKSIVNIAGNSNLRHSNMYKIDKRKAASSKYNTHPYINPLKVKSFARDHMFKSDSSKNNNRINNVFNKSQIKTERCGRKMKENIVISLNLEQETHSSNKQLTISQHESTDRNEKAIHLTIKITENDKSPKIKSPNNEEDDGSVIDLSFLDEIDVDEIVECLNVSDEIRETNVTASECYSQYLKNEDNTNTKMPNAPNDVKMDSTEKWHKPEKEHNNLSSLNSELKVEKGHKAAQAADYTNTKIRKSDEKYDEFMEICNVVNDPGFLESTQKTTLIIEQSNAENQCPLAIDYLADSCYPVIIKSCTIPKEIYDKISEYSNEDIVLQENSEPHHVNEDLKDNSSESAVSLTSYSTCNDYECSTNNNNTPEPILQEDLESDDIEQRAKNLLLSIFNNPELLHAQEEKQTKPICNRSSNKVSEKDYLCSTDSNTGNSNKNPDYQGTETIECNNNNESLLKRKNANDIETNVDNFNDCHKLQTHPETILPRNIPNKYDVLSIPHTNKNITETQIVENSIKINQLIKTNEPIGDQNKNKSEITKDNEKNSCNDNLEIEIENRIRKKDRNWDVNSFSLNTNNHDAKEDTDIEFTNINVSNIEISEKQDNNRENNTNVVNEAENDVQIITPEPNIEIVDLTADTEKKTKHKKITYNEVRESAQETTITENNNTNDDENVILPPIEPLKLPRDFAMALKLEQDISLYFNSELEITGIIKRGMYSDIYRARNKNTGEVAAAKFIRNRKDVKIGIQKAEWLNELQEGIPKDKYHCLYLHHALTVDGMWCFLLEYYPYNLEQVLKERGRGFPIDIVQRLARQLVSAVLLLRNHKIIHSDIKPNHILLDATNGRLKLGGFDESFQRVHLKSVSCIGTVHYRAPELILGYYVGHGIDVWATALVLYEMMTNIKLFPANTNNEVLYQQLCTVGPVPKRMLNSSQYKEFHYRGDHFFRDGMDPAYKRLPRIVYRFFESERIVTSIFGAYMKHWARMRSEHMEADYATLNQFCKLIKQMLLTDPASRLGIESVFAHGFIYA